MRASHSDRARVETELRLAFQEGRIQLEELDSRLTLTNEAKTYFDLELIVGDLPGGRSLVQQMSQAAGGYVIPGTGSSPMYYQRPTTHPVLRILAVVFLFNMLAGALYFPGPGIGPLLLIGGFIFMVFGRGRRSMRTRMLGAGQQLARAVRWLEHR